MWMRATCSLDFNIAVETDFLFMLRPRSGWQQWVGAESYILTPSVPAVEFTDPFGNLCQRMVVPRGPFSIRTSVDIESAEASDAAPGAPLVEIHHLPESTLPFLLPSRYCESDRFIQMVPSLVEGRQPGYDYCSAVVEYIRSTTRYAPGSSFEAFSACEVHGRPEAVCRDMAHLGIALCRALSIPARMVVGYFEHLQPMDMHAWFEAYVGGRWYTFDPTQSDLRGGRVAIAYGRDAADVAVYTQFGEPVELISMVVTVARLAAPPC